MHKSEEMTGKTQPVPERSKVYWPHERHDLQGKEADLHDHKASRIADLDRLVSAGLRIGAILRNNEAVLVGPSYSFSLSPDRIASRSVSHILRGSPWHSKKPLELSGCQMCLEAETEFNCPWVLVST